MDLHPESAPSEGGLVQPSGDRRLAEFRYQEVPGELRLDLEVLQFEQ
jgi:hypothetical protein